MSKVTVGLWVPLQAKPGKEAEVEAPQFEGRTRVEQHQMVYAAVRELLGGEIHALALRTRAPGEKHKEEST